MRSATPLLTPPLCESMCLCSGGAMMKTDDHIEDNHPHGSMCISVCREQLESIGYDGPSITIVSSQSQRDQAQACYNHLISSCRLISSSADCLQCAKSRGNFASLIRPPADTTDRLCPDRHQNAHGSKRAGPNDAEKPRSLKPSKLPSKPAQANKLVNVRLVSETARCLRSWGW